MYLITYLVVTLHSFMIVYDPNVGHIYSKLISSGSLIHYLLEFNIGILSGYICLLGGTLQSMKVNIVGLSHLYTKKERGLSIQLCRNLF